MAERKRRGLGRGLGALINSDSQEQEALAGENPGADDVSHETSPGQAPSGAEPAGSPVERGHEATAPLDGRVDEEPSDDHDIGAARQSDGPSAPETPDRVDDDASQGASVAETPERPIDVFFSAKSHLGTQRVSRGTRPGTKPTTTSRRSGARRAQMPDVMSERQSARTAGSPDSPVSSASLPPSATVRPEPTAAGSDTSTIDHNGGRRSGAPEAEERVESAVEPQHAWTEAVSQNGHGGSVDGAEFRSVAVGAIQPNPRQPRTEFDEEDMAELVHSVREIGVLQPIVVREVGPEQYELVMGERRWRASMAAERTTIPAIVRSTRDDDLLRDALLENIHRSQLNPLEEAAAYRQLLDDFNCTQDELAEKIGRSRPQISNTLRLMKLPPAVQRRVAAGVLSSGHARALLGLSSAEEMEELAKRIVAEGLSVRATEEAVTMAQQNQGNGVSRGTTRLPSTARYQQLDEYADALTDRLDTQVKITLGAKKGRIAIDFGSIEDLHRLMEMIGQREQVS
nr:ParB/RepB/Spo0J family partition protein [Nesterenkonia sp. PF2B19]